MSENQTEAELESFRQKWREEVSAKAKGKAPAPAVPTKTSQASSSKSHFSKTNAPEVPSHARQQNVGAVDGLEPVYQDLGGKQHGRRLDETSPPPITNEPNSALEHYEKAVEKEDQGSLGDSVSLYRKAFKVSIPQSRKTIYG
jgi:F-box protein 9